VAPELGNGADDDGIDAQNFADLGCRRRISAIAIGEILLGQDLFDCLALDHAVLAVFYQLLHEEVGDSLAYVLVSSPNRGDRRAHSPVVEVEYSHAFPRVLCRTTGNE